MKKLIFLSSVSFLFLTIFIVIRYFLATLITKKGDVLKKIKPLIFKNFYT